MTTLGRDGAEGGRRAVRRARPGTPPTASPSRARPARLRRAASCGPSRAPSSIPCRTSTPCSSASTRRGPAPDAGAARARAAGLRAPPQGARALARARARRRAGIRDRARAALEAIGRPADARAEPLAPERVARARAETARAMSLRCAPRARQGQPVPVRRPRRAHDGLHPLVSRRAAGLARRRARARAGATATRDEVVCPGVEGENLAARALAAFREATGWDGPPQRLTIAKRVPVAAGMGGGSADAAAALRLAAAAAGHDRSDGAAARSSRSALGADVPSQLDARALPDDRGRASASRRSADPAAVRPADRPLGARALARPRSTREFDRLGLGRDADELDRLSGQVAGAARADSLLAERLLHNDLEARRPLALPADRRRARRRARGRRGARDGVRLRPDRVRALPRRGRRRARARRRRGAAPRATRAPSPPTPVGRAFGEPRRGLSVHPGWLAGAVALAALPRRPPPAPPQAARSRSACSRRPARC